MPTEIHAYSGGAWRKTVEASTYTGGAWHTVRDAWVYNGGVWRKCYTNSVHNSVLVYNISPTCDPTDGLYSATWTYTNASGFHVQVEYDVGSGWTVAASSIAVTDPSYDGDLSGILGFTSLASTNFRVTIYDPYDGVAITNSPKTDSPPYFC